MYPDSTFRSGLSAHENKNMGLPGMKRLSAAVIALTLTGTASAVPIVMDFSGELVSRATIRPGAPIEFDNSVAGTAFSARFIVELDDFGAAQYANTTGAQRWSYLALEGATGISAFLSIGGVEVDMTPYDRTRSVVSVLDSNGTIIGDCNPVCSSTTPDQYSVNFTSQQTPPLSGSTGARSLQFSTSEMIDPFVPYTGTSFIDDTPLSLQAILMLPSMFDNPLLQSRLSFTDAYAICTDLCRSDYTQSTQMRIDSLNRYVASVPEPGTLGLMGVALGLTLLARRRRGDSAAASLNWKVIVTPA
jgi:hypothetical protein